MNENKHNVIRFHWVRDMITSGIVFCLCDMIFHNRPFTFHMFWEGVRFIFIAECIVTTIFNGLTDLAKEDEQGGNI